MKIIPWTSTFIDPTITSTERDDATFISKWAHKAQLVTVRRYWDVYAFVAPLVITLSMIGIETPLGRGTGSTEVLHQRLAPRRQSRALPDPLPPNDQSTLQETSAKNWKHQKHWWHSRAPLWNWSNLQENLEWYHHILFRYFGSKLKNSKIIFKCYIKSPLKILWHLVVVVAF